MKLLEILNYNATIRCLSISVCETEGGGGGKVRMNYRWECDAMALNSWLCLRKKSIHQACPLETKLGELCIKN